MNSYVTLTCLMLALVPYEVRADHNDNRQQRQQQRIEDGVRSGALTPHEVQRLENEQDRIDKMENRAKADGVVTNKEKLGIEAAQDHASRSIAIKKHNARNL